MKVWFGHIPLSSATMRDLAFCGLVSRNDIIKHHMGNMYRCTHMLVRTFLTINIAILSSYLTNQEPSQGIALQLDVLAAERDAARDTAYSAFPMKKIYTRSG